MSTSAEFALANEIPLQEFNRAVALIADVDIRAPGGKLFIKLKLF